ncbi:MAG TPA: hypothetical protein VFL82_07330 [Thermomicrobiales bacterium]|nr:hypothetical protein [Thermomicrobiales bacterium]
MRQRLIRFIAILTGACLSLGLFSFVATVGAAPSTPALVATPTAANYLTAIQTGTCDKLGDTVAEIGDLQTTQAEGGEGQLRGTVVSPPVLSTDKTIDTSLDDLTSNPHSITVRLQDTTGTSLIACGPITAVASNGQMAIGLQPMSEQEVAGVAVLEKAQSGNGTHVVVYLLSVVAKGGGVGATPTS